MSTFSSSDIQAAQLDGEHGPFQPSQGFARAAYESLLKHLLAIKAGDAPSTLSRENIEALPMPDEPYLDATGYWRLGAWLLEGKGGSLVLTYRPPQAEPRMAYVATLKGDVETLTVTSLTIMRILAQSSNM
ncbi:hypothetical protein [Corallococcus aberystwythensis]|uniref:hypothetical protein n=1 Tax=Corallococcus aberystwythensis TaxID=2316722 RepID=UPI0011C3B896|nr:hypothetical protein [Corallococcus aberystwythensis]